MGNVIIYQSMCTDISYVNKSIHLVRIKSDLHKYACSLAPWLPQQLILWPVKHTYLIR